MFRVREDGGFLDGGKIRTAHLLPLECLEKIEKINTKRNSKHFDSFAKNYQI
jgi:hypothetical protein